MKLGCVVPGESSAVFGDALRYLASAATYLYQDGPRVWYATQPTVTKLAEDRAEQLKRDRDKVAAALDKWLRADLQKKGDFSRVHPLPRAGDDVPDDLEARLVVIRPEHLSVANSQLCSRQWRTGLAFMPRHRIGIPHRRHSPAGHRQASTRWTPR